MDIGSILFKSAVSIVEKLVIGWIDNRKSAILMSDVNKQTLKAVRSEADNLRLRVKDLEFETLKIRDRLFSEMKEINYTEFPRKKIVISYNPDADYSRRDLLYELEGKIKQLEAEYDMVCRGRNNIDNTLLFIEEEKADLSSTNISKSKRLLQALQQKVDDIEEIRK